MTYDERYNEWLKAYHPEHYADKDLRVPLFQDSSTSSSTTASSPVPSTPLSNVDPSLTSPQSSIVPTTTATMTATSTTTTTVSSSPDVVVKSKLSEFLAIPEPPAKKASSKSSTGVRHYII